MSQTEQYPDVNFCGCCGRQMNGEQAVTRPGREPDQFCVDCDEHILQNGRPPWERAAAGQDKKCPYTLI